ncbi:arrestin domain protein [Dictyocaulus viviparus]|uniref:Arrestin domain protein n=1 Tax=Dictyocaulus viviparus TaxID=29172 RepID=A0A0D8X9N0_DICVI|nr:arrestin domain protein [Dictyocaulus viviparus]
MRTCFSLQLSTTQLNIVLSQPRAMAGELFQAKKKKCGFLFKVLIDSADPEIVIESLTAEMQGVGRTGWVNIHTDKIFDTEKASCSEVFPIVVLARSSFDDLPMNLLSPINFRDEIDFTCCSLPFGCVSLVVSLPRTAFRLGETVEAQITINNRTRKKLKDCTFQLALKTQFEAMSRYEHVNEKKLCEQLIELIPLGNVKARHKEVFSKCHIRIPEGAAPTQNYNTISSDTSIITIQYVLKFVALPGIEYEIPLIVTSLGYVNADKEAAFILHNHHKSPSQKRTTWDIVKKKTVF